MAIVEIWSINFSIKGLKIKESDSTDFEVFILNEQMNHDQSFFFEWPINKSWQSFFSMWKLAKQRLSILLRVWGNNIANFIWTQSLLGVVRSNFRRSKVCFGTRLNFWSGDRKLLIMIRSCAKIGTGNNFWHKIDSYFSL
jgi:hypothetical protein